MRASLRMSELLIKETYDGYASSPKQVWKMWNRRQKAGRQLQKDVWKRTCKHFTLVLVFKGFQMVVGYLSVFLRRGFNIWLFDFYLGRRPPFCLLCFYKIIIIKYHLFIHHLGDVSHSSTYFILFFFLMYRVGRRELSSAIDLELFE